MPLKLLSVQADGLAFAQDEEGKFIWLKLSTFGGKLLQKKEVPKATFMGSFNHGNFFPVDKEFPTWEALFLGVQEKQQEIWKIYDAHYGPMPEGIEEVWRRSEEDAETDALNESIYRGELEEGED